MIVYHHQRKKAFSLAYITYSLTTFFCYFPLSLHPKNSADNPKKFRVFTFFSRCWRDICVAYRSIYDVRLFFKRGNFPKDIAYRQKIVTLRLRKLQLVV
jgi:hypothetical protein